MKKFLLLSCLLIALWATLTRTEELPHIPGTELKWGMTQEQAEPYLPDTELGEINIRQIPYADFPIDTHPVAGQFYFSASDRLEYVQFYPLYRYPNRANWYADYEHLISYMTGIYGDPYDTTDTRTIWMTPETQGQSVRYEIAINDNPSPNGWVVRFDRREEEK
jgi:hypothetical protein